MSASSNWPRNRLLLALPSSDLQRLTPELEQIHCEPAQVLIAMEAMPSFRSLMYAYVQAFLERVLVSVACNGAHSLKQRLAGWLLTMRDRGDDDALQITQDLLAEMLGVQRPTVTNAARELEGAGLIARGRREVSILDRQGLIAPPCEWYRVVRARVASHLPKGTLKMRVVAGLVINITDNIPSTGSQSR
jgi:Crp-like helix-turn-helix domain